MGHSRPTTKRPTNITLDPDLVREARRLTVNLSATVEDLLRDFVARERARRSAEDAVVNEVVDALGAFHREHGLLSDEFPTF